MPQTNIFTKRYSAGMRKTDTKGKGNISLKPIEMLCERSNVTAETEYTKSNNTTEYINEIIERLSHI